jgi:hypothetical protein
MNQDLVVYAKRFRPFYFGAKPILGESLFQKKRSCMLPDDYSRTQHATVMKS